MKPRSDKPRPPKKRSTKGQVLIQNNEHFETPGQAKRFRESMSKFGITDFTETKLSNGSISLTWRTRSPQG